MHRFKARRQAGDGVGIMARVIDGEELRWKIAFGIGIVQLSKTYDYMQENNSDLHFSEIIKFMKRFLNSRSIRIPLIYILTKLLSFLIQFRAI